MTKQELIKVIKVQMECSELYNNIPNIPERNEKELLFERGLKSGLRCFQHTFGFSINEIVQDARHQLWIEQQTI